MAFGSFDRSVELTVNQVFCYHNGVLFSARYLRWTEQIFGESTLDCMTASHTMCNIVWLLVYKQVGNLNGQRRPSSSQFFRRWPKRILFLSKCLLTLSSSLSSSHTVNEQSSSAMANLYDLNKKEPGSIISVFIKSEIFQIQIGVCRTSWLYVIGQNRQQQQPGKQKS